MSIAAYHLKRPKTQTSFVVFASPHSGCAYPEALVAASRLSALELRSSEDAFVDRLFEAVPDFGSPLLAASYPRAWVDLNRKADELDPALIEGVQAKRLNPRVLSGLGVLARVVSHGKCIYTGKISQAEAQARIDTAWKPYHEALEMLLSQTRRQFGQALLIDCHSMPREALNGVQNSTGLRPQIVIGDRFGASARPAVTALVETVFKDEGFDVVRNTPFAGAYIAQHYGRPFQNQNVVQVEIDRSLYMNEATLEPSDSFADVQAAVARAARRIANFGAQGMSIAAQ